MTQVLTRKEMLQTAWFTFVIWWLAPVKVTRVVLKSWGVYQKLKGVA